MSTTSGSDEPLDLGEVEPGAAPAQRPVRPGAHPWAPSVLDDFAPRHDVECDCIDCHPER